MGLSRKIPLCFRSHKSLAPFFTHQAGHFDGAGGAGKTATGNDLWDNVAMWYFLLPTPAGLVLWCSFSKQPLGTWLDWS